MNTNWQELFNRVADGIQSETDELDLAAVLRASPEARRDYRAFMELHGALHWDASCLAQPVHERLAQRFAPPTGTGFNSRWLAAAIASAIVIGVGGFVAAFAILPERERATVAGDARVPPAASQPEPLAIIKRTQFLVPGENGPVLQPGRPFSGGRLAIRGGAVELMLRNGVTIILEGPGEIDLIDEMAALVREGRVFVRMPKGMHGFRVRTASADVLDLGTEFAVGIGSGNATDVQVYDGAVIASSSSKLEASRSPKRLEAGQAARFRPEPSAESQPLPYRPDRFVRELKNDGAIAVPVRTDEDAVTAARIFGRPQHDSITVHRAPPAMIVDGQLDEWAGRPGFTSTRDGSADCPEWANGRMMYDDGFLYIAAHVGDPLPLRGIIDPEIDAEFGWHGGGVQVRVSTDRRLGWPARGNSWGYYAQRGIEPTAEQKEWSRNPQLSHLTMWFHAPTQTPCLTIVDGMLVGELRVNPAGFTGAFQADKDGKGYTLEYAIPWTLLGCADDPPQSGDVLAAVWQVNWSDEVGHMRREHMVEIRNRNEPLRINVFERAMTWGRAEYR